jgi:hypothetical protein
MIVVTVSLKSEVYQDPNQCQRALDELTAIAGVSVLNKAYASAIGVVTLDIVPEALCNVSTHWAVSAHLVRAEVNLSG